MLQALVPGMSEAFPESVQEFLIEQQRRLRIGGAENGVAPLMLLLLLLLLLLRLLLLLSSSSVSSELRESLETGLEEVLRGATTAEAGHGCEERIPVEEDPVDLLEPGSRELRAEEIASVTQSRGTGGTGRGSSRSSGSRS